MSEIKPTDASEFLMQELSGMPEGVTQCMFIAREPNGVVSHHSFNMTPMDKLGMVEFTKLAIKDSLVRNWNG